MHTDMKMANPKIQTSKKEIKDLGIAWVVISVAFGIVLRPTGSAIISVASLEYIFISALTVGIGFLLHEFSHKVVAQKYRCWAEFRKDNTMLFLALIMSFFGFVFAAPGAVMIFGQVTRRQNGIISIAGPLTNLGLAVIFFVLGLFFSSGFLGTLFDMGFYINSFLALFNMLPFGVMDGKKVLAWNKTWFYGVLGVTIIFFLASFLA